MNTLINSLTRKKELFVAWVAPFYNQPNEFKINTESFASQFETPPNWPKAQRSQLRKDFQLRLEIITKLENTIRNLA